MKLRKLLCLMLPALLCLFLMPAAATQAPDLTRTGSIRLTIRYEGAAVGGGELTLYQIATLSDENGFRFVPVSGLEEYDFSAASLERPELASDVLAKVKQVGLTGQTARIGNDGFVRFDDLPLGLYLIEQTVSAPGFTAVNPFFVTIPMSENGDLVYDVDASPKPEPLQPTAATGETGPTTPSEPTEPTEATSPTNVTTPTGSTEPTVPDDTLPQTGQLNWPIPVLAVIGALCLLAGLLVLLHGRKERTR